jgi:hypothetical protein
MVFPWFSDEKMTDGGDSGLLNDVWRWTRRWMAVAMDCCSMLQLVIRTRNDVFFAHDYWI